MKHTFAAVEPSAQQTLDIFNGVWASKIPTPGETTSGTALLFDDFRVRWAVKQLAERGITLKDAHVLELGPLEGGHTKMLADLGVASVTAVEASTEAYLKCLVVKELLGLERVNFLFGDATRYLKTTDRRFQLGFACGILYHLVSPVEFIAELSKHCDSIYIWTQCWIPELVDRLPHYRGATFQAEVEGFRHTLHRNNYGDTEVHTQFWGGNAGFCYWMEPEQVVAAVKHFGFSNVTSEFNQNEWGALLQLVATK